MIWKKILPPDGGGALRRLIRIRKEMFEHSLDKQSHSSFDQTTLPLKPLTILDFQRPDDAADARAVSIGSKQQGWRISDDEVIGGFSRATFTLMNELVPNPRFSSTNVTRTNKEDGMSSSYSNSSRQDENVLTLSGVDDANHNQQGQKNNHSNNNNNHVVSFVRWAGNIDTRIGPKSRAKRSGFCAIRCPEFPLGGIPVGEKYNALEVRCRTDGRAYTFNLKVQSYFPDDLYQSLITVQPEEVRKEYERTSKSMTIEQEETRMNHEEVGPAHPYDGFVSVVLPFRDFILTSYGRIKAQQRNLEGGVRIEHLGITLMDGKDGPFTFDLARIRLVNYSAETGTILNDDGATATAAAATAVDGAPQI